ncbi:MULTISPECIES: hypothetical protein [Brevibacterium]|uniref:Uncharacterized protein n=3 Tax=Brevibacterium linens TaxID=1703 RepID=A0A2H1HUS4_BRELN|nr:MULTISPECIES: hypothetical protein [Brevibacterium]AZU00606.1 hypothetical protein CXR29_07720 [Brevibacterium linens]KAB1949189.1 hypothetical protein F8227_04175 [Brevibacterium linens ATCC 9172]SMX66642.1 hypothetical protein BLIN101_00574 [Brevibacterium linens]SMX71579.1 hypothetical protein BLIN9172_00817 [Brevibacterium linens ATCC 9172]
MTHQDPTMMDIIGTILSRLVNVALFLVIGLLSLVAFMGRTDLHVAVCGLLAVLCGVIGTILLRLLFRGIARLGGLTSRSQD